MDKQNNLQFPNRFTLLMTGPTVGLVGEYGKTWDGHMGEYERINVVVEGATMKLEDSEQYIQQMKGISTAALGYWKEGETVHPDYDTPALRDVARLYAKYAALHEFSESVRKTVTAEQANGEDMLSVAKVRIFGETVTFQDARLSILKNLDGKSLFARVQDIRKTIDKTTATSTKQADTGNVRSKFHPARYSDEPISVFGADEDQLFPERDPSKPAEQQGLFRKFEVRRVDGSDQPGGKHYGCRYYVLDLDHDQHAPAAMRPYAASCASTHPQLAADIVAEFGEDETLTYAKRLANAIWLSNYAETAPQFQVLPDLMGVLSQIDNMVSGMKRIIPVDAGVAGAGEKATANWNRETLVARLYNNTPTASLNVEAGAEIQQLRGELSQLARQRQDSKPTDLSKRLRAEARSPHPSCVSKDDLRAAADEIERYYGGMLNWKRTAELLGQSEQVVEYVPIAVNSHDEAAGRHPNDKTPIDTECQKALDARGDDSGQGLCVYWKWGFRAGWHDHKRITTPSAQAQGEPVATVIKSGAERQWMSEGLGKLPDGMYSLYLGPAAQVDEVRDAARYLFLRERTVAWNALRPPEWKTGAKLDAAIDAEIDALRATQPEGKE